MDTIYDRAQKTASQLLHGVQAGDGRKVPAAGVSVALLARNNGINDNLLFKWRSRYRHFVEAPVDEGAGTPVIIEDKIVPVVVERPPALLPAVSPAPATQPKPGQVCELAIGRARLKLSGNLTPVMLATLVRELKKGRR